MDLSDHSLGEAPLEEVAHNLSHNALFNALTELTEEEESSADTDLKVSSSILSHHPIEELPSTSHVVDEKGVSISYDALSLSAQYTLDETNLLHQTSLKSHLITPLVQYPLEENTVSFSSYADTEPPKDIIRKICDIDQEADCSEPSISPEYGMCSTRPGTVIEGSKPCEQSSIKASDINLLQTTSHGNVSEDSKLQSISIGDTLIHTKKSPISASHTI